MYDLWNTTTRKKIAFDVSAAVALHWIGKLATEHGRAYVHEHVRMLWWPPGALGQRFGGGELLDLLDCAVLYGMPE